MNLPPLGPLSMPGFANAWFFRYLVVVLRARRERVPGVANMGLLGRRSLGAVRPAATAFAPC